MALGIKTVLLINDDPVQLHLLGSLLGQVPYQVKSYLSAEVAWQWILDGNVPDGVVLDLHMPGISGWRFCELIQDHFRSTGSVPPILAVSATYSGPDAEEVLKDLGASAFLSLPAEPWRIRQAVSQLWDQRSPVTEMSVWVISALEAQIERMRHVFQERGWQVSCASSGEEAQRQLMRASPPDIVVIDGPLPDMTGRELAKWCRTVAPRATRVRLEPMAGMNPPDMNVGEGDLVLPKGCDPNELLARCEKGRWERTLSRVEHLLETRTTDLRESEAQFQGLFEMLPDILVIYDATGVIRHINTMGARQLGYETSELIGQPLSSLYVAEETNTSLLWHSNGSSCESGWKEVRLIAKDGKTLWTETSNLPVRFAGNSHVLLIARDLRERKEMEAQKAKLEQQLRQAQKMEAVGRLASGIAHDMNNIMTAVLSHAGLLKTKFRAQDEAWVAGDVIEKAIHRGRELTTQLLGFARQGKHHHVAVNLHDVIREVVGLLNRTMGKSLKFQVELNADSHWVVGDPNQIFQVFMNLAVNGCDAMKEFGELRFSTMNETISEEQASHVPGLSPGEYAVIRVTDTGEGIPMDIQGKIFEPFFSTKEPGKGSGMGLAMVYGIVKNHRGYIGVTSTLGAGTTMKIYLPITSPPCSETADSSQADLSKGTGHVLVVDDEPDVAGATRAVLEFLGYQVSVVLSGKDAVDYCRNPLNQVDLVLLDMIMPDMSGPECFIQLKYLRPGIIVILCTGYDRNHAVQELLDQGVAAFIQKPYDIDCLAQVCADLNGPNKFRRRHETIVPS